MFIPIQFTTHTQFIGLHPTNVLLASEIRSTLMFNVNNIKILKQVQITILGILLIFSLIFNLFFKITPIEHLLSINFPKYLGVFNIFLC